MLSTNSITLLKSLYRCNINNTFFDKKTAKILIGNMIVLDDSEASLNRQIEKMLQWLCKEKEKKLDLLD